jgi:hypothetical protein
MKQIKRIRKASVDKIVADFGKIQRLSSSPVSKKHTALYLFVTLNDIEPEILGPFNTESERDKAAGIYRNTEGIESGIFRLDIDEKGKPNTDSYSGGEMDRLREEAEINTPKGR